MSARARLDNLLHSYRADSRTAALDAHDAEVAARVRAEVLAEALAALLPLITSAGSTGQRVGISRAMDELRRMATNHPAVAVARSKEQQ